MRTLRVIHIRPYSFALDRWLIRNMNTPDREVHENKNLVDVVRSWIAVTA